VWSAHARRHANGDNVIRVFSNWDRLDPDALYRRLYAVAEHPFISLHRISVAIFEGDAGNANSPFAIFLDSD
jgi:hypothetical protein